MLYSLETDPGIRFRIPVDGKHLSAFSSLDFVFRHFPLTENIFLPLIRLISSLGIVPLVESRVHRRHGWQIRYERWANKLKPIDLEMSRIQECRGREE